MPRNSNSSISLVSKFVISSILLISSISALVTYQAMMPYDLDNQSRFEFEVAPNENIDKISSRLESNGLINSKEVFKVYLLITGISKKIQAGFFYISPSQSASSIANTLTKAQTKQVWITIPEGLRREEIANIILDTLSKTDLKHNFNPQEFINLSSDLEGHLYPDTYAFSSGISAQSALNKLTTQFNQTLKKLNIPSEKLNKVLILASLIEREASQDSERAEIAGILNNRLKNNWPLQIDATVQFSVANLKCSLRICDWWPSPLSKEDLSLNSPYNTYKYTGLPPGPISNPGEASLKAATNPNVTENWFYLHDTQGKIHYAKTVEEHNKNICLYLKKSC